MKTKEELNALKEEVGILNKKLAELSEEDLEQLFGGVVPQDFFPWPVVEPADRSVPHLVIK